MRMSQDPRTGKFTKGNPGRPKGSRNERTLQWEELGKEITERNAAKFNDLLGRLWENTDVSVQVKAAELFLRSLEFFRPKLQRMQIPDLPGPKLEPPRIVIERHVIGADGLRRFVEDEPYTIDKSLHRS